MGTSNFYVLDPDGGLFGTKWAYGEKVPPINRTDCEYCPICNRPVTMLKWLPPYRIKISSANPQKWGDFIRGPDFFLMVSENFRQIYENEQLSGIQSFSPLIEITKMGNLKTGVFPVPPPKFYLAEIPWDGANQDDAASELEWYGPPRDTFCQYHQRSTHLYRKQKRIMIEDGTWKGGDLFLARGAPHVLLVTERFKKIAEDYHLKNVLFFRADDYGYDDMHLHR